MLDSPYVRRVAISLKRLGIPFDHRSLSVFRHVDEFTQINPLVKAPTLVCDDGTVLVDSTLILNYIEELAGPDKSLMPEDPGLRLKSRQLLGVALVACEKTVQIVYEQTLRPEDKQYQPWLDRVTQQLHVAYGQLESVVEGRTSSWLLNDRLLQADITIAVAWRFTQFIIPGVISPAQYPALAAFSTEVEALPEFQSTPLE